MIATDKMKAAFAATPLCQHAWTERGDAGQPTKLCAISALVAFAGVQPELIDKMRAFCSDTGRSWVETLVKPVVLAEYGIRPMLVNTIVQMFDNEQNEWQGVVAVLDFCERQNKDELHCNAIVEDGLRFPQLEPAASGGISNAWVVLRSPNSYEDAKMTLTINNDMLMQWTGGKVAAADTSEDDMDFGAPDVQANWAAPTLTIATKKQMYAEIAAIQKQHHLKAKAAGYTLAGLLTGVAK